MANAESDVVDAPFCRVCRRSSDVKWRKHVFSKSHQHAAAAFLAARVACLEEIVAQVNDVDAIIPPTDKLFCAFCDAKIESLELWVEHYGSPGHRRCIDTFCIHNRCDAAQIVRVKLCIPKQDTMSLLKKLEMKRHAATVESTREANVVESILERLKNGDVGAATLEAKRTLQSTQTEPLSRPIPTTRSRATDMGYSTGLSSIDRRRWKSGVANIHSSAVPPWMVTTEEEYTQVNRLPSSRTLPAQHTEAAASHKRARSGDSKQVSNASSQVNAVYDEKSWLPNFGSVWQEGPRSRTKNDFAKSQQPSSTASRRASLKPPAPDIPQRAEGQPGLMAAGIRGGVTPHIPPPTEASQLVIATVVESPSTAPSEQKTSALDAKTQLLMAQKERLRAKMLAKRKAPS